jgi:thiamine-phosphate pyrophosphorylase
MLRYAITDRTQLPGDETARRLALFALARRWAEQNISYIQLRERDLPAAQLETLSRAISHTIHATGSKTRLLINSRADVALAAGAHGVHLTAAPDALTAEQVRSLFARAGRPHPAISISCHTLDEVARASQQPVDLILFGPVFGKSIAGVEVTPAAGLESLHNACRAAGKVPVLALGGITTACIPDCLAAGAAGIAAIRLFLSSVDAHPGDSYAIDAHAHYSPSTSG